MAGIFGVLDAPIITELADTCEITLGQFFSLIQKQGKGEEGVLLTNGYANIAYRQPIVDAAINAGFADQSHMTRAFVRQFGVTPGRYVAAIA